MEFQCMLLTLLLLTFLPHPLRGACDPPCDGHKVCLSGTCLTANDAAGSCSSTTECADQVRGYCSGTCKCNSGKTWSWYRLGCYGSNYANQACGNLNDCMDDRSSVAGCVSGTCRCIGNAASVSYSPTAFQRCGVRNDASGCSASGIQDDVRGSCVGNMATCNTGFELYMPKRMCLGENNGQGYCDAVLDCMDNTNKAICTTDHKCKCRPACTYSGGTCSSCSTCVPGTYSSDGIGPCTPCPAGQYQDGNGKTSCKTCGTGQYQDQTGQANCKSCISNCASCTGATDCATCNSGYYLYTPPSGSLGCYNPCPTGHYGGADGACHDCMANCAVCSSVSICITCDTYYSPSTVVAGANYCIPCLTNCISCPDTTSCNQCAATYFLYDPPSGNDQCLKPCPNYYYGDTGDYKCKPCPISSCRVCASPSQCTTCDSGFYLYDPTSGADQCLNPCPDYYYEKTDGTCQPCLTDCKDCTGPNYCTACRPTMYLHHATTSYDLCVLPCPDYFYPHTDFTCQSCLTDCRVCTNPNTCITCRPSYFKHTLIPSGNNQCLVSCPAYFYNKVADYTCQPCLTNCITCTNGNQCNLCDVGYFRYRPPAANDQCLNPCPDRFFEQTATRTCEPCTAHCLDCTNSTDCSRCDTNYYVQPQSVGVQDCVNPCNLGWFNDVDNVCKPCSAHCKYCSNSTYCTECFSNYYLKKLRGVPQQECVDDCGAKYYPGTSAPPKCEACDFRCLTCSGPGQPACTSCDLSLPGVAKISSTDCDCASGYAANVVLEFCEPCADSFCLKCNPLNVAQCFKCSPVTVLDPVTLVCNCAPGTYKENGACVPCNVLCSECAGGTNTDCLPAKCGPNAYPLYNLTTTCLYMCTGYAEELVLSGGLCKPCDISCNGCTGPTQNECVRCRNKDKVLFLGTCLDVCPDPYYPKDGICEVCADYCLRCTGIGACLECASPYLLQKGNCVAKCSVGFYPDYATRICPACAYPCLACESASICYRCARGYYWYKNKCWTADQKPYDTYLGETEFLPCSTKCRECFGPRDNNCISCKVGYLLTELATCKPLTCAESYYPVQLEEGGVQCYPCDKRCKTCVGGTENDCLECTLEYFPRTPDYFPTRCLACKEIFSGLALSPDKTRCVEDCGDGINFGQYECDDGNVRNGDGCSSACRIEPGFACRKTWKWGNMSTDFCYSLTPPQPYLRMASRDNKKAELIFTKRIQGGTLTPYLIGSIGLKLVGGMKDCPMSWTIRHINSTEDTIDSFDIDLDIRCTVKAGTKLKATFADPGSFSDENGVCLTVSDVGTRLYKSRYADKWTKLIVGTGGDAFSAGNWLILFLALGQYLVQSVALGSVWALVNMLQILFYTPVIDIYLPENLRLLLTNYLSISQLKLPESLMFIPTGWISDFKSHIVFVNLEEFGLETISFLYNFYQQLFTWVLIFCFYLLLVILDRLRPKGWFEFIRRWKEDYVYNGVLRILLECYLDMAFYSTLNVYFLDNGSPLMVVSSFVSCLAFALSLVFLSWCARLTSMPLKTYSSPEFKQHYSTICEEMKVERGPYTRGYYCIFLIRRLFFAFVLVSMSNVVRIQLQVICIIDVALLAYLVYFRPYEAWGDNYLNIFNECVILTVHVCLVVFYERKLEGTDTQNLLGWVCVGLILASAVHAWLFALVPMLQALFLKILGCVRGVQPEKEKDKVSPADSVSRLGAKYRTEAVDNANGEENEWDGEHQEHTLAMADPRRLPTVPARKVSNAAAESNNAYSMRLRGRPGGNKIVPSPEEEDPAKIACKSWKEMKKFKSRQFTTEEIHVVPAANQQAFWFLLIRQCYCYRTTYI